MTWGAQNGTITVNSSTGANTWSSTPTAAAPHSYLARNSASDATFQTYGNGILQNLP
jgi:hypothetical protein